MLCSFATLLDWYRELLKADFDPERPSAEIEYSQGPLAHNARFSGGGCNMTAHISGKVCCKFW